MTTVANPEAKRAFPLRDELSVPKGAVIFHQGDPGDSMFVIEKGRVQILLASEVEEAPVAVLQAGDFFGELSLLSDAPRTATAQALDDSILLVVRRAVFAMMMHDDLGIVFRILRTIGERLCRTDQKFGELMRRRDRMVLLTELLRSTEGVFEGGYGRVEVVPLAVALRRDPGAVRATIAELAARGAGVLENGWWRVEGPAHVRAILELLRVYADNPLASPPSLGA